MQVVLFKAQCVSTRPGDATGITLYMINIFSFICLQYVLLTLSATKSYSRRVKAAVFRRSVELWDNSLHNNSAG